MVSEKPSKDGCVAVLRGMLLPLPVTQLNVSQINDPPK